MQELSNGLHTNAGRIERGRVYDIQAECTGQTGTCQRCGGDVAVPDDTADLACTRCGDVVERVDIRAYFTGEIDVWGKATFQPVDGGQAHYLFAREITCVEAI